MSRLWAPWHGHQSPPISLSGLSFWCVKVSGFLGIGQSWCLHTQRLPGGPTEGSKVPAACNGGVGEARAWRSVSEAPGAHLFGCRLTIMEARGLVGVLEV